MFNPTLSLEWSNNGTSYYWASANGSVPLNITNNNLYNKYYSKYIQEITNKDSKLITMYVKLTPIDIANLSFTKLYWIDNHYLRLYKVENYNPLANDLTKCIFIKANEGRPIKSGYVQPIGGGVALPFGFSAATFVGGYTGYTGPIADWHVINTPIGVSRDDIVSVRNDAGSSHIGGLVTETSGQRVFGYNNVVDPMAQQIFVQGNNNRIESGTVRINITNSDNIIVRAGVRNVNVINTVLISGQTLTISESDITYIDGNKYKNGKIEFGGISPIVLDGGLNELQSPFTDFIPNILDGGLDEVQGFNSASIVNLFDGGLDQL